MSSPRTCPNRTARVSTPIVPLRSLTGSRGFLRFGVPLSPPASRNPLKKLLWRIESNRFIKTIPEINFWRRLLGGPGCQKCRSNGSFAVWPIWLPETSSSYGDWLDISLAPVEATRRPIYTGDMKSTDPRVLAFIRLLREECRAAGVRIIFKNVRKLRDWDDNFNRTLDGYFVHPTKKQSGLIVVAAKVPTPQLLHTLAHEYVHFTQWRAKKPSFYSWGYVAHENITEKSALRLLEEHNLPINLRVRKQRSRAYIKKLKTGAL